MTRAINTMPSLYLEAGAIHGCVLCKEGTPVCYTEDVGRHNAVDKIAAGSIATASIPPTRSSTPPAASPPRW
jgi:formate dehydrogenase accessory protein FdhD